MRRKVVIISLVLLAILGSILGRYLYCSIDNEKIFEESNKIEGTNEKIKFLMSKADVLLGCKKYSSVIDIAEYIRRELKVDTKDVRSLIGRAKMGIRKAAERKNRF